ncbi:MAG: hypothetical protein IKQ76_08460 [Bacteroidales bacterium]|nr:hypothetical protein [Bacteroidales bacterium]
MRKTILALAAGLLLAACAEKAPERHGIFWNNWRDPVGNLREMVQPAR